MADRTAAGLESYAHRGAKRLLVEWLREAASVVGVDGRASFANYSWRVNRPAPTWGIWEEVPVLAGGIGIEPTWDEISDRWEGRPPTFDEAIDLGFRPMCVLDVAVQHKGRIELAIEIRHKHGCGARKVGFLRPRLTLLEVPAYWVLGQVSRPNAVPAEFWL